MDTLLLTLFALAATGLCGWFYWQIQQAEQRLQQQESQIREQAVLVGELADEISMASQYLYEAMDRCLVEIESHAVRAEAAQPLMHEAPPSLPMHEGTIPSPAEETNGGPDDDTHTSGLEYAESSYHPHFQALEMALQGLDPVEIARRTGLGVEELRLLLRFQEELSVAG